MAQTFSILGFSLALLALYFASEVMRRASHRQTELEAALFKAVARIQKMENSVYHVEKLAAEIRHQRKRQAQTITALANKGENKGVTPQQTTETEHHAQGSGERFTPSTHAGGPDRKTG